MAQNSRTIRDGVIVGIIGYFAVAGLYAAFDQFAARGALYTVDMLGKSVFRGLRDTSILGLPMQRDVSAILLYSGFHLLMSLSIGLIVTGLVTHAERQPSHARIVLVTIVAGFAATIAAVGMLTIPIRPLLPWWSIVAANASAVIAGGIYLLWKRPDTWRRLSPFAG